ncbi:Avirulence protein (Avh) [Phytophthora palmivora]|uniref:Avirulence protein (Avh) n=1 Tax=Phytophthora palmivora TaxID=4796 RepID=A0A2P4Y8I4_9STRA|nr:Avirulence protein (Avh) [Phytophthora palmivora]
MHLLYGVLIWAAISTHTCATMSITNPNVIDTVPRVGADNRILRVGATIETDDEERLALPKVPSSFTSWFTGNAASKIMPAITSKLATTDDELLNLLNKGVLPTDVFRGTLKLDRVDDLFTDPKLNTWVNYLNDFNTKYPEQKTTMLKTLTENFGDAKLTVMINAATKNAKTKVMAENLQAAQLNQWLIDKKPPHQMYFSLGLKAEKNFVLTDTFKTWAKYNKMYNSAKKQGTMY